jgi:hypothetical protein
MDPRLVEIEDEYKAAGWTIVSHFALPLPQHVDGNSID